MNRHLAIIIAGWTILIAGVVVQNLSIERSNIEEQARIEARAIWYHNLSYRKWITAMGGVYVRRDRMKPNPYLTIPDRDKKTVDGIALTMANPAYMTSQVFDIIRKESTPPIVNRIVSDKYLNPHNSPDEWERQGLRAFARGAREVSEITTLNGQPYLRLFKPMIATKGCLKCHGQQGYKVGDIRGGISVAVPMKHYYGIEAQGRRMVLLMFLPLWALGVGAGSLYFRGQKKSRKSQQESEVRLALALEAGNQAWWEWNFETGETVYGPGYYQMLGYEPDEFPPTYDEWKKRVHPDDIARAEEFIRRHLVENKTDYRNLEMRMMAKDGTWRWVSGNGKIVERNADGNPVRLVGTNLDIDERKQAEESLRMSEERYRALFDGVPDALVIADIETGRIIDVNPSAVRLLGRPRDELVGMHQSAVHPARIASRTRESFREHSEEARRGNIAGPFEHVIVRADGTEVPVEIVTQPVIIAGKTMIQGVFRDISERKRDEEQMLRSDQRLRLHRELSPLGFLEWDENFQAIEWNAACERIFGYTREEAIGRHAKNLILPPVVHDLADGIYRSLMNQTGGQHSINENVTKDGRTIICEWFNTTLINKEGKAIGIASICNDITEQKSMEAELAGYREHLEEQVRERTAEIEKKNKELEGKNEELKKMNRLFVGRELRIAELKERIRELKEKKF